jgi:hypothetical protein
MARVLPGKTVYKGKEAKEIAAAMERSLRSGGAVEKMKTASKMAFPVRIRKPQ